MMYLAKRALVDTVNIKASVIDRKLDRSKKAKIYYELAVKLLGALSPNRLISNEILLLTVSTNRV